MYNAICYNQQLCTRLSLHSQILCTGLPLKDSTALTYPWFFLHNVDGWGDGGGGGLAAGGDPAGGSLLWREQLVAE